MGIIEVENRSVYARLKSCLAEIYPQVKIEIIYEDTTFSDLGFSEQAPCTVKIHATAEQIFEIMDIAMDYEIAAYNTPDGGFPEKDSPEFILYEKYGWLWDFFNQLDKSVFDA